MYLEHCAINYFLKSTKENLPAAPDSAICLKYILSNSSLYQHTWWRLLTPPTYRMETPHSTNMQDGDSSLHQHTGWRLLTPPTYRMETERIENGWWLTGTLGKLEGEVLLDADWDSEVSVNADWGAGWIQNWTILAGRMKTGGRGAQWRSRQTHLMFFFGLLLF